MYIHQRRPIASLQQKGLLYNLHSCVNGHSTILLWSIPAVERDLAINTSQLTRACDFRSWTSVNEITSPFVSCVVSTLIQNLAKRAKN